MTADQFIALVAVVAVFLIVNAGYLWRHRK